MSNTDREELLARNIARHMHAEDYYLAPDLGHRLNSIRQQVILHADSQDTVNNRANSLALVRVTPWYLALSLMLAILLSISMLWMHSHSHGNSDAYLLSEDLPPEAFIDEEFDTWITKDSH